MRKRILIYNWIPFDETEGKGGGVTVYIKNLISWFLKNDQFDIYFLSSGRAYDINQYRTFIEPTVNIYGEKVKSFQVVNSPVLSAANLSFPYPDVSNNDEVLKKVVGDFMSVYQFDVVHFQNLEGLGIKVLELKDDFPGTRFIYSVHNYYMICPQVMLWQDNQYNCREKECGECCISCMPKNVHFLKIMLNQFIDVREKDNPNLLKMKNALAEYYLQADADTYEISKTDKNKLKEDFRRFREQNVAYVNRYMDVVLAVSKKVSEIIIEKGVSRKKVHVNYIGTSSAEQERRTSSYPYLDGEFHICYLGYMRTMKGFYFLLDALDAMPETMSEKISVTIAAKITDEDAVKRISALKKKFFKIVIYDGYTHEQLPDILKNVNLGIVPPLWEDNLPQVAIEMQAEGIPILCSDLGGAKEIVNSGDFVFEAGNIRNFIWKLKKIIDNPELLERYWIKASHLTKMEEHIQSLMRFYNI